MNWSLDKTAFIHDYSEFALNTQAFICITISGIKKEYDRMWLIMIQWYENIVLSRGQWFNLAFVFF